MKKGYFFLSHELLRETLHLPYNAEIIAVDFYSPNTCKVWVEHPDIPETLNVEGSEYLELNPTHLRQEPVVFMGWGFKE